MVHSCPRECYTARRRRPPTLTSKHPPGCTRLRLAREPRRVAWYTGSAERADSFRRSMPGVEELGAAEAGADTRARAYLPWLFKAGLTPEQARPRAARARRRPRAPPKRCPVPAPARAASLLGPATGPRAGSVARVRCSRAASLPNLRVCHRLRMPPSLCLHAARAAQGHDPHGARRPRPARRTGAACCKRWRCRGRAPTRRASWTPPYASPTSAAGARCRARSWCARRARPAALARSAQTRRAVLGAHGSCGWASVIMRSGRGVSCSSTEQDVLWRPPRAACPAADPVPGAMQQAEHHGA